MHFIGMLAVKLPIAVTYDLLPKARLLLDWIALDGGGSLPLYRQLYFELRAAIVSSRLPAGSLLPSSRTLSPSGTLDDDELRGVLQATFAVAGWAMPPCGLPAPTSPHKTAWSSGRARELGMDSHRRMSMRFWPVPTSSLNAVRPW